MKPQKSKHIHSKIKAHSQQSRSKVMADSINKLIMDIKKDIESQAYSLQSVFDKHFKTMELLKSQGVKYQYIYQYLALGITRTHFDNLLYRTKKKRKHLSNNKEKHSLKNATSSTNSSIANTEAVQPKEEKEKPIHSCLENDFKAVCFNNERLIKRCLETDLSPTDVKNWQCANQFQLSDRLSEYRRKLRLKRK
ncbi:hypothetical protein JCM19239_1501 [Vibrio variabilis]|uniref:Uncharacterized protein n=1 Tax=Vibrio variabilis TaxID=990271 RepID=A0ABQ0JG85_9VIBR|nr:hypothetical protein JCM19239_1501 [Vibrio variabilis]